MCLFSELIWILCLEKFWNLQKNLNTTGTGTARKLVRVHFDIKLKMKLEMKQFLSKVLGVCSAYAKTFFQMLSYIYLQAAKFSDNGGQICGAGWNRYINTKEYFVDNKQFLNCAI